MGNTTRVRDDRPITGEDLFRLGDIGPCELIDGRIVPMSPTGRRHGRVEAKIAAALEAVVRSCGISGEVLAGEVGIYTRRDPDRVRGADVAFLSARRAAQQVNPAGFLVVPPELVIEVMSPEDTVGALDAKALEYLAAGVILVLVVDPEARVVRAHRLEQPVVTLDAHDTFEAPDILPGASLPITSMLEG